MALSQDDLAAIRTIMQEEVAHSEARLHERIDAVETGLSNRIDAVETGMRDEFGQKLEAVEMSVRAAIMQSEINLRREIQTGQRANVGLFNALRTELKEHRALPRDEE